jgi:hypothetical protein
LVTAVRLLARALPKGRAASLIVALLLSGLSFYGVFRLSADSGALGRLESDHRLFTGGREYAAPLDDLARRISTSRRPALLGGINQLSEALVRWRAWQRGREPYRMAEPLRGLSGDDSAEQVRSKLVAWLERERPDRVVAMVFPRNSARFADGDFLRYNAWQVEAWRYFARSDTWRRRDRRRYRALGFDLVSWEPRRHDRAAKPGRHRHGARRAAR